MVSEHLAPLLDRGLVLTRVRLLLPETGERRPGENEVDIGSDGSDRAKPGAEAEAIPANACLSNRWLPIKEERGHECALTEEDTLPAVFQRSLPMPMNSSWAIEEAGCMPVKAEAEVRTMSRQRTLTSALLRPAASKRTPTSLPIVMEAWVPSSLLEAAFKGHLSEARLPMAQSQEVGTTTAPDVEVDGGISLDREGIIMRLWAAAAAADSRSAPSGEVLRDGFDAMLRAVR